MKLPILIAENLDESHFVRWNQQFLGGDNSGDRTVLEGLWRRTQDIRNKKQSGWGSEEDARRRIVHYIDKYSLSETNEGVYQLNISEIYLWLELTFPSEEISGYFKLLKVALEVGGWTRSIDGTETIFSLGDITMKVLFSKKHKQDVLEKRVFPSGYKSMEVVLSSKGAFISDKQRMHPWAVLKSGFRQKDTRGNPNVITDLRQIDRYLPA